MSMYTLSVIVYELSAAGALSGQVKLPCRPVCQAAAYELCAAVAPGRMQVMRRRLSGGLTEKPAGLLAAYVKVLLPTS